MKSVLILGGSGYIGSECISQFLRLDYRVINLDLVDTEATLLTPEVTGELISIQTNLSIELDHSLISNIKNHLKGDQLSSIICFAAWKDVMNSIYNPVEYYRNNINIILNFIELGRIFNVNLLIFSSSAAVYDSDLIGEIDESSPITYGQSPYADTKLIAENILKQQFDANGIPYICLRYFNPIGATEFSHDESDSLFGNILRCIWTRDIGNVYGSDYSTRDGSCIRDFIDIRDLANAHVYLVNKFGSPNKFTLNKHILNVGTGKGTTILEVMECVKSLYPDFMYRIGPRRIGDSPGGYACTKSINDLGWKTKFSLSDSIKSIIKYGRSK